MNLDLATAAKLLTLFVDDEECSYDHHGTCQAHLIDSGPGCPMASAREFLGIYAKLIEEGRLKDDCECPPHLLERGEHTAACFFRMRPTATI